jgi:cell division protein FtsQ
LRSKKRRKNRAGQRPKKKAAYWRGEKVEVFLKRGILALSAGVLIMAAALGVKLAARSFPVRNIMISGNYHLDELEIMNEVKTSYGRDLLRLSLDEVETRLKQKAWIRTVLLRKQFPDTLMINVSEAVPRALIRREAQMYLVDSDGNVLERIEDESTPFLPVIVGIDPENDRGGVLESLKLIDTLDREDFLSRKESVEIMIKPYGLVLIMDGEYIKVGYGRYDEKLRRWRDLEAEIRKQDIPVDYVDLRYENEVIVKPLNKARKGKKNKS